MTAGFPTLVGGGAMLATTAVVVGFALAIRTDVSAPRLALLVGGIVALGVTGLSMIPQMQTAVTVLAYVTMVGFPLYALFWILHDFVERVVRA